MTYEISTMFPICFCNTYIYIYIYNMYVNVYIYIYMYIHWLVVSSPLNKYEFANWDDDISNWMEKWKSHVPVTHIYIYIYWLLLHLKISFPHLWLWHPSQHPGDPESVPAPKKRRKERNTSPPMDWSTGNPWIFHEFPWNIGVYPAKMILNQSIA